MGRFYKTAKPEMLDFMFKVPEQAIMTAIKGADAQIEGQEAYLTDLQKQLKTAALDEDEARRKQRVTELEGKIREHSLKLFENPLLAIKEQKGIRDLGQEIYKDLTEGELYAYNTNYTTRQKYYEKAVEDATGKDGRLNVDQVKNAMAAFDAQYKMKEGAQFNKETGKFNPYGTELLYDYVDRSEYAKKTAEGWVTQDTKNWGETLEGQYWKKEEVTKSILGLDELTFGILNTMTTDETVMQPLIQGLQHQAQTKAAQILKASGGDFNKLYKQEFDKLYIEYFGEKDEATNKLALEPVLNEDGTPAIDETTKKPIMQFKNPGKLYQEAKAAADKKDKNEIGIGISYTADEFAKINAKLEADKALAQHNKDINIVVGFDTDNKEVIETTLPGDSYDEIVGNLDGEEAQIQKDTEDYKKQLLILLTKDNPGAHKEVNEKLKLLFSGDTPDFEGIKTYLNSKQVGAGDKNLTGADDFQRSYEQRKINLQNQRTLLDATVEGGEEDVPGYNYPFYYAKKVIAAGLKDEITKKQEALKNATNDEAKKQITAEINQLQKDFIIADKERKQYIGRSQNYNTKTEKNLNTRTRTAKATSGDQLIDWGASKEEAKRFQEALNTLEEKPIWNWVGGGSNAQIRNNDGTGMMKFSGSTMNDYFFDLDTYTQEINPETKEFEITDKKSGQLVFKGKTGNYSVAIDDFNTVGANAITTTITGRRLDKNGNWVTTNFDVFIPASELKNSTVSNSLAKYQGEQALTALTRKAEANAKKLKNPDYIYQHNKYISVMPRGGTDGKALYIFNDGKGNIEKVETSQKALDLFKIYNK